MWDWGVGEIGVGGEERRFANRGGRWQVIERRRQLGLGRKG